MTATPSTAPPVPRTLGEVARPGRARAGRTGPDTPLAVSGHHLPALDGVRALAILGVMAYHLGWGWASGGYLGVDLFFVLSGFLITSLLVEERCASGSIRLGAFWGRRARRLLPALFLLLVAISLYAVLNGRFSSPASGGAAIDLSPLRGDALAALFYVANWHALLAHQSYFAQFSTPSPLEHTWSLAIEEQFYLVWPLVLVVLFRSRAHRWRRAGLVLCAVGAVGSALAMGLLFHPGADPSRVYYGTDTRAFDLLAGAAVAFASAGRAQPGRRARTWLHTASLPAAVALGVFWATAGTAGLPTDLMFRGGFLLCAVLAALVIADVRQSDAGPLARLLSVRPLRWIGTVSYGLYLWHWPVFVYLDEARTGLSGAALDTARVATTFAMATVSFYVLERPVRRRVAFAIPWRLLAPAAVGATALAVVLGTAPSVAEPAQGGPRHIWVGGLYPGAGPRVAGAGGVAGEVPIALPSSVLPSRANPLRVTTFGDSIMRLAQHGIAAALDSTGTVVVSPAAVPGWGLDRPTVPAHLRRLVTVFHPQILVGTWSWDAAQAAADPARYRSILDAALRRLLTPGNGVLGVILLQMPALGPNPPPYIVTSPAYAAGWRARATGIPAWNAAARQAAATFPGKVMYLPVASAIEIDGHYTDWMPPHAQPRAPSRRWVRVRTADHVHLCPPGITRYAAPVLQDLTTLFRLPAPTRPWWKNHQITVDGFPYDPGVGLDCPHDHPPPGTRPA